MYNLLLKSTRNLFQYSRIHLVAPVSVSSSARFSTSSTEKRKVPNVTVRREISSKPLSKESIYSIAIGAVIFCVVGGLNLYLRYKTNRYSDPSNRPVYDNKRPTSSQKPVPESDKSAESSSLQTSSKSIKLPPRVKHVIIGAGATGMSAARAIRSADPLALVLLIAGDRSCGEEEVDVGDGTTTLPPPYVRPVLSGGLWWRSQESRKAMLNPIGDIRTHSWFYYEPLSFFIEPEKLAEAECGGICLLRGNPVVSLNPDRNSVVLADGQEVQYDCCLLATGVRPIVVPEIGHCSHSGIDLVANKRVTYFRNIADYKHLQALSDRLHKHGGRMVILGSSQLACELATSFLEERHMTEEEKEANAPKDTAEFHVHQILGFESSQPLDDILPPALAKAFAENLNERGVMIIPSATVVRVSLVEPDHPAESRLRLIIHHRLDGGIIKEEILDADHVVCAVGNEPRTELGVAANLEVDPINGGFIVNNEMRSRSNIFVAGGAASYWDSELDCRRRVDHISASEDTGELAGLNMVRVVPPTGDKDKLAEASATPDRTFDLLPFASKYQSALFFSVGKGTRYESVGLVDAKNLFTRTVFMEGDQTSSGVVFYLRPEDRRLMGVLLWNLPDGFFKDPEYAVPNRISVARKMIADRLLLRNDDEVLDYARHFDLSGEIAENYEELKAFVEAKKAEEEEAKLKETSGDTSNSDFSQFSVTKETNSNEEDKPREGEADDDRNSDSSKSPAEKEPDASVEATSVVPEEKAV